MVNAAPEFETIDALGNTTQYSGTVGLTPILVPPSPGRPISEILIRCDTDNTPNSERLEWSIEGVVYQKLSPGEFIGWTLKKNSTNQEIKQIYLRGTTAAVFYEVLVNTEEA